VSVPEYPLFEYPPYSLALASKMAEIAEREGLELIHAHYAIPHAASALLARDMLGKKRLAVVTTLHGTDITLVGRDPSFLPVTRYSIEQSDAVSAVSHFLRSEVCRTFTCDKEISVIHNFVDPRDFAHLNPSEMRSHFAPAGQKLLVHVSNFRKVKRVEDVAAVFLRIRRELPARLILVGSGPELPTAEHLVREAGAEDDLLVLGVRNRVLDIISACDVLLQPSQTESFGLTPLEAMACGVPPVATMTGGLPEVVDDGVTGYLLPVGDVDGMAARVMELLTNPDLHRTISANARRTALERFNIESALDAYEELYRNALGRMKDEG
jgi:N-acetyl-alpha-D-glucosaminyl L-malate synthase BshA